MGYGSRALLILLSALALFVATSLLGLGIDMLLNFWEIPGGRKPEQWRTASASCMGVSDLAGAHRRVQVQVSPEVLVLRLSVDLPAQHPCVAQAFSGDLRESLSDFVAAVFGEIKISGKVPDSGDLKLEAFRNVASTVHIQVEHRRPFNGPDQILISRPGDAPAPATDELSAQWKNGIQVSSIDLLPDLKTATSLVRKTRSPELISLIDLRLEEDQPAVLPRNVETRSTRQGLVQRLGSLDSIPFLSYLLWGIRFALPLLLALIWLRRNPSTTADSPLVRATEALLIFHVAYFVLAGVSQLAEIGAISKLAREAMDWAIKQFPHRRGISVPGHEISFVTTAVLGIAVPVLMSWKIGSRSPQAFRILRWAPWAAILLLSGASIWSGVLALEPSDILVSLGVSLSLLALLLLLLLRGLAGKHVPSGLAAACALAATSLLVLDKLLRPQLWAADTFWFVVATLLGALLVRSMAEILWVVGEEAGLLKPWYWLRWREVRFLAMLVVLLIAAPLTSLPNLDTGFLSARSLNNLAVFLDPYFLPIWVVGVIAILRADGDAGLLVSDRARLLGLLAAAALLFSPNASWFELPVTFLLGWLALDRILVRRLEADALDRWVEQLSGKRPWLIDAALDRHAAEHALRGYRRKQFSALLAGDVDFDKYEQKLDAHVEKTKAVRARTQLEGQDPTSLAFAMPAFSNAWRNGLHGARYASLLALPWVVLGFRDLLGTTTSRTPNPLLDLVLDLVMLLLRWAAVGFVLGYFFPYLRGRSGLAKGLYLCLCLILPTLPLAVIWNSNAESWLPTLFLYLQTFIHCVLLGLFAFDLEALRQGGQRDWRLLFEVHGIPAVGGALSSLAIAIGTAITTLLTTQISGLVGAALRVVLPEAPTP